MAFTTIAITGTFYEADGSTLASGNVTFIASTTMNDSATNAIVTATLATATLASGVISLNLTATTDPTTQPTGVTYEVTENIDGAGQNKYSIEVPHNSPNATLDLADITPAITPVTTYSYATQQYLNDQLLTGTTFSFNQESPTATWSITHNLGYKPAVSVVDTSDTVVVGDIDYTDLNVLVVTFAQSFAGKAYLS
jgi:hypothetical protein